MRRTSWKWIVANCLVVVVVGATVAVAASGGGNGSGNRSSGVKADGPPGGPPFGLALKGRGDHLAAVAKELGVSTDKLQAAIAAVRDDFERPKRLRGGERPTRAEMEKRCNALTDAIGKELGKSGADVRAASKAVIKADIEKAVDAGDVTRAQADRALDRLDDAACLPVLKAHGRHEHGCGPRPGRDGGRDEESGAPAPRDGSFAPARGGSTLAV